jgi:predicted nucleic acid-binding protein
MRVLLDTNIFLDLLLQRDDANSAEILLNSIEMGLYEGVVLDITLINIDYIAQRQGVDARYFLEYVVKNCKVVGADNTLAMEALGYEHSDFEDVLQYVVAKQADCDVIVTNDKGFFSPDIPLAKSVNFKGYLCKM